MNDKVRNGTFKPGSCTCIRCKEGNGDQSDYSHKHTFKVDGEIVSRVFTSSDSQYINQLIADGDIEIYLPKAKAKPGVK